MNRKHGRGGTRPSRKSPQLPDLGTGGPAFTPAAGVPQEARRSDRINRAAVGLALAAVVVTAAVMGFRSIWGWDIGFYLALGRWIAEHRQLPAFDPLTFTMADRALVDMYWLYERAAWGLYAGTGTLGLIAGNLALTLASMGIAVARAKRRAGDGWLTAAILLLPFVFGNTWEIRPHAASWLYLNVLLLLLERRTGGARAPLWIIPPLMAMWTNTHALFALGLVLLAAYALGELLRGRAADRPLIIAALAGAAACLLNPYGAHGLTIPLAQWQNLQDNSVFKSASGILEYRTPLDLCAYRALGSAILYRPPPHMHAWLLLSLAAMPFFWRRAGWGERLAFVLTLAAFLNARKNFGYFFFAGLPLVALGCGTAMTRLLAGAGQPRGSPLGRAAVALATGTACAVVALHARSGYLYHSTRGGDRPGPGFNPHTLPVRAAEFLNRGDVPKGRMLNALHDGGYLSFATRRHVFIDGRLELGGPERFQAHMATVHPDRLGATMVQHDLQFAVVPYPDVPSWFLAFAAQEAWRCVHLDDYSAVFFRADFAPSIPAVSPRVSVASIPGAEEERLALRRGTAMRNPGPLESLRRPQYYPLPEIHLCRAYQELGHTAAAVAVGLEGLRRTTFDAPDLLLNLGSAYWLLGRRDEATVCYRAWLTPRRGYRPNATTRALILARLKQTES